MFKLSHEIVSSEAAEFLGCHRTTLVRWTERGLISCRCSPGGNRFYLPSEVQALKEKMDAGIIPLAKGRPSHKAK